MAAEISHLLAATQQQPAKRRKDCQYNDKEKEVLCKYKDEYKGLRTHAEREALLRGKVFVDIFNYWLQEEGKMPTEEMVTKRIEELCEWIRNNWRPAQTAHKEPVQRKTNRLNIVWHERKAEVMKEIKVLYAEGGGEGEPSNAFIFSNRNTAAKNVYGQLAEGEKARIERLVENSGQEANPPDVQKSRATKLGDEAVIKWALEQWRDKGMITVTFYGYMDKKGKVQTGMHDRIASNAGRPTKPFVDMHRDLTDRLQVKFLDYAKTFLNAETPASRQHSENPPPMMPGTGATSEQNRKNVPDLDSSPEGFPLMPALDDKTRKEDLEDLIRRYLAAHYKLASGNRKKSVPYGALKKDQNKFVDKKYYPAGFKFEDPRNIQKEKVLSFCQHIRERQERHGASEAFRFSKYVKGGELVEEAFGIRQEEERAAVKAAKAKEARASSRAGKKGKSKGKSKATGKGKGKEKEAGLVAAIVADPLPFGDRHTPNMDAATTQLQVIPNPVESSTPIPIDPALLALDASTPAGTPAIDPFIESGTISIDEDDMRILTGLGHPALIAANGPSDGLPKYHIPASTYAQLAQHKRNTQVSGTIQPAPGLPLNDETNARPRPRPRPVNKKTDNSGAVSSAKPDNARAKAGGAATHQNATSEIDNSSDSSAANQRPNTRSTSNRKPVKKKSRNADMRAIEEAQKLLKPSSRARREKSTRRT